MPTKNTPQDRLSYRDPRPYPEPPTTERLKQHSLTRLRKDGYSPVAMTGRQVKECSVDPEAWRLEQYRKERERKIDRNLRDLAEYAMSPGKIAADAYGLQQGLPRFLLESIGPGELKAPATLAAGLGGAIATKVTPSDFKKVGEIASLAPAHAAGTSKTYQQLLMAVDDAQAGRVSQIPPIELFKISEGMKKDFPGLAPYKYQATEGVNRAAMTQRSRAPLKYTDPGYGELFDAFLDVSRDMNPMARRRIRAEHPAQAAMLRAEQNALDLRDLNQDPPRQLLVHEDDWTPALDTLHASRVKRMLNPLLEGKESPHDFINFHMAGAPFFDNVQNGSWLANAARAVNRHKGDRPWNYFGDRAAAMGFWTPEEVRLAEEAVFGNSTDPAALEAYEAIRYTGLADILDALKSSKNPLDGMAVGKYGPDHLKGFTMEDFMKGSQEDLYDPFSRWTMLVPPAENLKINMPKGKPFTSKHDPDMNDYRVFEAKKPE